MNVNNTLSTFAWLGLIACSIGLTRYALSLGWNEGITLMLQAGLTYALLSLLELGLAYRHDWRWWGDWQVLTDVLHALFNEVFVRNCYLVVTFMLISLAEPLTSWQWASSPWLIALGVVMLETAEYWRHRLLHRSDLLWPFHALHHHLDRMHIFRSGRIHLVDGMSRVIVTFLPALLLGVPAESFAWWLVLLNAIGPVSHSNLPIATPRLLNRLVVTPMVHRVHHASDDAMMRCNLAPVSPLVDQVFGSWCAPERNPIRRVGIQADFFPRSYLGQLLAPFRQAFR